MIGISGEKIFRITICVSITLMALHLPVIATWAIVAAFFSLEVGQLVLMMINVDIYEGISNNVCSKCKDEVCFMTHCVLIMTWFYWAGQLFLAGVGIGSFIATCPIYNHLTLIVKYLNALDAENAAHKT